MAPALAVIGLFFVGGVFVGLGQSLEYMPIIGLTTVGQISDDTAVLSRLYIHPHCQRQGIGSQLLQAGITAFPTARTIRLEVEENNQSAYTFYHHHGFRETESKEERVEGDVIKVKVMEKLIGR